MIETLLSLKEKGICPTCYNIEHGYFHKDISGRMLYEDEIKLIQAKLNSYA